MRKMMMVGVLLALAAGGCGQAQEQATEAAIAEAAPGAAPPMAAAPSPAGTRDSVAQAGAQSNAGRVTPLTPPGMEGAVIPAVLPQLAYTYRYTLETPNDRVASLMRRHEQQCVQAGPAVCQVLGATLDTNRDSEAQSGTLNLRAQPQWLASFRAALDREAQSAGGRVIANNTTTEDLTRQIIDTEAHLRARITLRDRMQQLLATRSGSLQELVYLEQELSRVQGELDAAQSQLNAMRTRVATSALTVEYRSTTSAVTEGTWRPLGEATDSFVNNLAAALAVMVTLVSWLLPFALVGALIWWLTRGMRRRGQERRAERVATLQRARASAPNPPPPV